MIGPCLQRAYCMRVLFQKYACANTLCAQMCACNTHAARLRLACCVLAARRLRAFFSARGMFAIFISVLFSSGLLWWVSKECGMGQGLVLVSPCFRENIVATCKIGSFLCSLDNLLQKNVIVLFFGNQVSKWRSFEKRAIFDLLFTFFSHQGKVTKIPSAQMSLTYIHVFCSPYWLFYLTNVEKHTNLSDAVSLWYESWCWFLFRAILEQSINNKMVSKI